MMRRALVLLLLPGVLLGQALAAVTPQDYGKWESPGPATLAPRGDWLAYGVTRVDEANELRILGMRRDTTYVVQFGQGPVFTPDGRWVAYAIGVSPAERERLERDRRPVRNSMGLRDLATGEERVVPEIASFRFSGDGRFIAMRRHPATGRRGSELLVQQLGRDERLTFGNVSEYAWADAGALLAFTIDAEGGTGNGVQLFDGSTGIVRPLDSSPSLYRGLAWRPAADDLAVLRTAADRAFRDTTHVVLAWSHLGAPARSVKRTLDPAAAQGIPSGMRIAEHRRPEWSKDGSVVFIGIRPRQAAAARADSAVVLAGAQRDSAGPAPAARADTGRRGTTDRVSDVQIWHSRDVRIIPMQRADEQRDLQRTLLTAWHQADGRVVQIGTQLQETVRVLEGARHATETDRAAYAWGTMFGRPYQDVWVIDVGTGERRKALERVRHFYGGSATGRRLVWYDGKDYWSQDVTTGARTNLTARLNTSFANPDYDTPTDLPPPLGIAGWTKDDRALLVHDEYDVWQVAPDGSGGRRLTNGAEQGVVHRYARTTPDDDGIDLGRAVYLTLHGKRTKQNGYARLTNGGRQVQRLFLEDTRAIRLQRADSVEVFAFTRERFDEPPRWFVGPDPARAREVARFNPFQSDYAWGRAELVDFTSRTGVPLQAALYYPANYDPARRYPMIVYTYERLAQNVHNYVVPSERSYYGINVFTAQGYFVLTPDIVFRPREPGIATLDAVEPAVRAVVARGLVDSTRVGHVGHSWGGYEAAFLPTRTHMFAASVAGAPITNFMSFPGAIHWTPGLAEFDHWETGQARMEVPPWEDVQAYLRNSPIAQVHELRTPMLMMFGDADGVVDWHQGVEFYNFVRRAGRPDFVLLVYPGEDHGLRKRENQVDYHRRILEWFGHYLKGDPAPAWITDGMSWLDRKAALDGNR